MTGMALERGAVGQARILVVDVQNKPVELRIEDDGERRAQRADDVSSAGAVLAEDTRELGWGKADVGERSEGGVDVVARKAAIGHHETTTQVIPKLVRAHGFVKGDQRTLGREHRLLAKSQEGAPSVNVSGHCCARWGAASACVLGVLWVCVWMCPGSIP